MFLHRKGTLVTIVDNNRFRTCLQWYVIKNARELFLLRTLSHVLNLDTLVYIILSVFIANCISNCYRCKNKSVFNDHIRRLQTIQEFEHGASALDEPGNWNKTQIKQSRSDSFSAEEYWREFKRAHKWETSDLMKCFSVLLRLKGSVKRREIIFLNFFIFCSMTAAKSENVSWLSCLLQGQPWCKNIEM